MMKIFLRGLVAVLPVFFTFYIVWWILSSAELVFRVLVTTLLPERFYLPGMGLLLAIVLTAVLGILLKATLLNHIFDLFESLLLRVPVIKTIYGGLRDFSDFFSGKTKKDFSKGVLVKIGDPPFSVLGFVTAQKPGSVLGAVGEELVGVYLPMSYQMGGYTVFVPQSAIAEVDLSVEETLRFVLTAGVSRNEGKLSQEAVDDIDASKEPQ